MLTESEEAEREAYVNVGDLLAFWQSTARRTLQHEAPANLQTRSGSGPVAYVNTAGFANRQHGG